MDFSTIAILWNKQLPLRTDEVVLSMVARVSRRVELRKVCENWSRYTKSFNFFHCGREFERTCACEDHSRHLSERQGVLFVLGTLVRCQSSPELNLKNTNIGTLKVFKRALVLSPIMSVMFF